MSVKSIATNVLLLYLRKRCQRATNALHHRTASRLYRCKRAIVSNDIEARMKAAFVTDASAAYIKADKDTNACLNGVYFAAGQAISGIFVSMPNRFWDKSAIESRLHCDWMRLCGQGHTASDRIATVSIRIRDSIATASMQKVAEVEGAKMWYNKSTLHK